MIKQSGLPMMLKNIPLLHHIDRANNVNLYRILERIYALLQAPALVAISIILLLAAGRFIVGVDDHPVWFDEAWTADAVHLDIRHMWHVIYEFDVHPPLYYGALYAWKLLVGYTTFSLRFLSVLLGLLSVATLYRLGKDMFNLTVAGVASLLYVLNDFVLRYAQEVRSYALLLVLVNLTVWFYWRMITRHTRANIIGFILLGAGLLYTHYWGGLVLLALGVHALFAHRRYIIAFLAMAILYLPRLPFLIYQYQGREEGWIPWAISNNWSGFKRLAEMLYGKPYWLWLTLIIIPVWFVMKRPAYRPQIKLAGTLIVIPLLVAFGANQIVPVLIPRYLYASVPVAVLVVGFTITSLRPFLAATSLVGLIFLTSLTTHSNPSSANGWPEAMAAVVAHTDNNDMIFSDLGWDDLLAMYHGQEVANGQVKTYSIGRAYRHPELFDYPTQIEQLLAQHDGAWVLVEPFAGSDYTTFFEQFGWQKTGSLTGPDYRFRMDRFDKVESDVRPSAVFGDMQLLTVDLAQYEDQLAVNLLWTTTAQIEHNYIVSVFLLDQAGRLHSQHDSPPLEGASPTSSWQPQAIYYDGHTLDVGQLPTGDYQLGIRIYRFVNDDFSEVTILKPDSCQPECDFAIIRQAGIR